MNYHNRIMNLRTYAADRGYRQGHRDARHDAAEIALEAEREIERLREALNYAASMPMVETLRAAGVTEGIVEAMQKEWLSKAPKHYAETLAEANRND